jgi:hypothetical protein
MIFVDTLIYFEGPLLELYIDKIDHNRYYLCRWVDDDERRNRWLVYSVDRKSLVLFFQEKKTSLDLIKSSLIIYILDSNEEQKSLYSINYIQIPHNYLPEQTAMFNNSSYTEYASDLKQSLLSQDEALNKTELNSGFAALEAKLNMILEQTKQSTNNHEESNNSTVLYLVTNDVDNNVNSETERKQYYGN